MQLGDILRNTVLVTIAGKQLGSGVHCRIPGRRGGVRNPNVESHLQWSLVLPERFGGTLECSERLLYASHGACNPCNPCNLGHDLPDSVRLSFETSMCTIEPLRSGCRFQFGDNSVPARIATSPKTDRIRKRTADTTRPFQTTRGFSVTRDPRDLSCMVLESTMSVHVAW